MHMLKRGCNEEATWVDAIITDGMLTMRTHSPLLATKPEYLELTSLTNHKSHLRALMNNVREGG